MTLHGQAQAIRKLASVLPAQYVRQVLLAPSAGGIAPLTDKRISRAERADGPDQHAVARPSAPPPPTAIATSALMA